MKKKRKNSKGQAIVEYIIIIVIVAVAALTVMGIFSDRIRTIIAGVASTFGSEDAESAVEERSALEHLQQMEAGGIDLETEGGS
jgi:Flp pilus assembly pilin Flp